MIYLATPVRAKESRYTLCFAMLALCPTYCRHRKSVKTNERDFRKINFTQRNTQRVETIPGRRVSPLITHLVNSPSVTLPHCTTFPPCMLKVVTVAIFFTTLGVRASLCCNLRRIYARITLLLKNHAQVCRRYTAALLVTSCTTIYVTLENRKYAKYAIVVSART